MLFAIFAIALAGLVAGQLGGMFPLLDLANIALVPLAIVAIALAIILALLTRRWAKRIFYGLATVFAAWLLIPPPSGTDACENGTSLRIAWLNLQGSTEPEPIIAWLEAEQPDVVGFGELHASVEPTRAAIAALYPHSQSCLPNGRCSTILYARNAPRSTQALSSGNVQNRQSLSAARMTMGAGTGEGDAGEVHIVATHLSRPPYLARQREELDQLQLAIEEPADTVLIGDFNMVRRMKALSGFARRTGFSMTPADRATWPLWWKGNSVTPFVQIDHVLTGRNWRVTGLRTSDDLGSDHRGIVTDLCRAD